MAAICGGCLFDDDHVDPDTQFVFQKLSDNDPNLHFSVGSYVASVICSQVSDSRSKMMTSFPLALCRA